jgi:thioesterase domain-containing protein
MRKVKLKRFLRHPISYLRGIISRHLAKRSDGRLSVYKSIEAATERAIKRYRPAPYKGDVVLFQTYKDNYIGDIRWIVDEYNGWKALIQGGINVHRVPGVHLTVCQHPENATVLADLFNRIVRDIA